MSQICLLSYSPAAEDKGILSVRGQVARLMNMHLSGTFFFNLSAAGDISAKCVYSAV